MKFEYSYSLPTEEVRDRLRALGDYLTNRHNVTVAWDGDRARFNGRFKKVVAIDGELSFSDGKIMFLGKDPGLALRGQATKYLKKKLELYLDPETPLGQLARS
jgi:hypothetical protein